MATIATIARARTLGLSLKLPTVRAELIVVILKNRRRGQFVVSRYRYFLKYCFYHGSYSTIVLLGYHYLDIPLYLLLYLSASSVVYWQYYLCQFKVSGVVRSHHVRAEHHLLRQEAREEDRGESEQADPLL